MEAVLRWLRVRGGTTAAARAALAEDDVVLLRRGAGLRVVARVLALLGVLAGLVVLVDGPLAAAVRSLLLPLLVLTPTVLLVDLLLEHRAPPGVALGRRGVWLGGNASSRGPAELVPWSEVAALTMGTVDAYATTRHLVGGHVVWGGTRRPPLDVGVRLHVPRPRAAELAEVLDEVGVAAGRSVRADADALGLGTTVRTRPVGVGENASVRELTRAASRFAPQVPVERFGDVRLRSEDEVVAELGRRVSRLRRGRPPTGS